MEPPLWLELAAGFGAALLVSSIYMALVWVLARKLENYGVVDTAWSYGVLLFISGAILVYGDSPRAWGIAALGAAWSLRLGTYLLVRTVREHPHEDSRYKTLREEWGPRAPRMMFLFFQLQAFIMAVLALPFLVTIRAGGAWGAAETVIFIFTLLAILGETLADLQMYRFKKNPANRGRPCDVGLWRYSRHPNYFFESLVWIGLALFALPAPGGWIALIAPTMMLFLLLRFSGVPFSEKMALASRGAAYEAYIRTTSSFIPLPKRRTS
jgi:steroid 5-alpha reductase family enzyme